MTTNTQPIPFYRHTVAEEALMDALDHERETYGDTYAYDGEGSRFIPADLVDAPHTTTYRLIGEHDWLTISGQDD